MGRQWISFNLRFAVRSCGDRPEPRLFIHASSDFHSRQKQHEYPKWHLSMFSPLPVEPNRNSGPEGNNDCLKDLWFLTHQVRLMMMVLSSSPRWSGTRSDADAALNPSSMDGQGIWVQQPGSIQPHHVWHTSDSATFKTLQQAAGSNNLS